MPISTVWILKYVQQCYVKWFWTISSLGAPVKCSLCSKNCFLPYSRLYILFELPITRTPIPITRTFFRFPLKVRVIWSQLYLFPGVSLLLTYPDLSLSYTKRPWNEIRPSSWMNFISTQNSNSWSLICIEAVLQT